MSEEVFSWSRRTDETNRWFGRFEAFRLMGPGRSINAAVNAERVAKSRKESRHAPGSWRVAAQKWDWQARAEAWDQRLIDQKEAAIRAAQEAAEAAWREKIMGPSEILARLSEQGRSNPSLFISQKPKLLSMDEDSGKEVYIDSSSLIWEKVVESGHLIKKISYNQYGPVIELYNVQDALKLMGQHEKLFSEQVDLTMKQEIKGYTGVSPDDWDAEP